MMTNEEIKNQIKESDDMSIFFQFGFLFAIVFLFWGSMFAFNEYVSERNSKLKLEDYIPDTTYDGLKTIKYLHFSMDVEEFQDGKKVTLSGDKVLNLPKGKGVRFVVTRDSETSYRSEFLDFVDVKN